MQLSKHPKVSVSTCSATYLSHLIDDGLLTIFKYFSFRELCRLRKISKRLDEFSIFVISKIDRVHISHLQALKITSKHCRLLYTVGLYVESDISTEIENLVIKIFTNNKNIGTVVFGGMFRSLAKLLLPIHNLTCLKLMTFHKISTDEITTIFQNTPQLSTFVAKEPERTAFADPRITMSTLTTQYCGSLTRLRLSREYQVPPNFVKCLAQRSPNLRELNVFIFDDFLSELDYFENLEVLHLYNCFSSGAYKFFKNVVELHMHGRLDHIPVYGCKSLKKLYLDSDMDLEISITSLTNILRVAVNLEALDCPVSAFGCALESLSDESIMLPSLSYFGRVGDDQDFKLPPKCAKVVPNLRTVRLRGAGLYVLASLHKSPFDHLKKVIVTCITDDYALRFLAKKNVFPAAKLYVPSCSINPLMPGRPQWVTRAFCSEQCFV